MICTPRFNFVHMPKTGGTWVRRLLEGQPFVSKVFSWHAKVTDLSREQRSLPIYIFVRNPWDLYVSMYAHKHTNVVKRRYEFRQPFVRLDDFYQRQHRAYEGDFERSVRAGVPWAPGLSPTITGTFFELVADDPVVVFRYEEGVRPAIRRMLSTHGYLTPQLEKLVEGKQRVNVGDRKKDYRKYYPDGLRQLVASREATYIEKFEYEF